LLADLEIRLLEATRERRTIGLDEFAGRLQTTSDKLKVQMADLAEKKTITLQQGILEMDTSQRIRLAEHLIHDGRDPQKVSRFLKWQEFEEFGERALDENGFRAVKHIVFKSKAGRREIDLLAWNDTLLLAIDCKHWARGISPSQARQVAQAQVERAEALAERFDLLNKYGVSRVESRQIMPVLLCLGSARQRLVDGVPVVAVSKLISFLYGVSPVDETLRRIPVRFRSVQSSLI
jgi:Holliday junction resolvase-like predicted endonuclease